MTALTFALKYHHLEIVQCLFRHGALASREVMQELLDRAQATEHLHLLATLLQHLSQEEMLSYLLRAYGKQQWWTMLAMLTLEPGLVKAAKKIDTQHQAKVAVTEDHTNLSSLMQQLEQLPAEAKCDIAPTIELMVNHIKTTAKTIQTGMESTKAGVVPIEIAQMIVPYASQIDVASFEKERKKQQAKKPAWRPFPKLALAFASLLARNNPTTAAREQQQVTPLRA